MKRFFFCVLALSVLSVGTVFAQSVVADDNFSSLGSWQAAGGAWKADGRLVQGDAQAPIAQIRRQLPQSGVYEMNFTIAYAAGGYKNMQEALQGKYRAGFGVHIGIDKASPGRSWGNGKSYLLWVNLDTLVPRNSPHFGLRGQVYQSRSDVDMTLMDKNNVEIMPITAAINYLGKIPGQAFPVRLVINTNDGEIRVYDPADPSYYYYFYLDPKLLKGSWVSLRTSKLSAAFNNFKVTKIR